jgi:hypothetical protein
MLLPSGRSYELANSLARGYSGVPSVRQASSSTSELARWLGAGDDRGVGEANGAQFPQPEGYEIVRAAWSALSTAPEPVRLKVDHERTRREWF